MFLPTHSFFACVSLKELLHIGSYLTQVHVKSCRNSVNVSIDIFECDQEHNTARQCEMIVHYGIQDLKFDWVVVDFQLLIWSSVQANWWLIDVGVKRLTKLCTGVRGQHFLNSTKARKHVHKFLFLQTL